MTKEITNRETNKMNKERAHAYINNAHFIWKSKIRQMLSVEQKSG